MKKVFLVIGGAALFLSCSTKKSVSEQNSEPQNYIFVIPSAFTPNGDGENDEACFISPKQEKEIKGTLQLFNRWGQELWKTENLAECWDGINPQTNKPYPSGTYMVMIKQNGVEKLSGAITLLR